MVQPVSDSRFSCDVIDSRPCKNPPQNVFSMGFLSIISSQLGDLSSPGYPTDSADPLKAATQACWKSNIGSNLLRINKHPDFFGEGFFGSRIFSFFLFGWPKILRQNLRRVDAFGDSFFFSGFACFYGEMERERGATSSVKSSVSKPLLQHAIE